MKLPGDDDLEPPPILGTWPRLYTFILLWLGVVIAVLYGFTRYFA